MYLDYAGKISALVAEKLVVDRYNEFNIRRRNEERLQADAEDIVLLDQLKERAKHIEYQLNFKEVYRKFD